MTIREGGGNHPNLPPLVSRIKLGRIEAEADGAHKPGLYLFASMIDEKTGERWVETIMLEADDGERKV